MFSFTSTLLQTEAKMGGGKPEKGENNDYDRQLMERGNATHFLSTHTPNKTANAFLLFFPLEYHFLTFGFRIGKLHNLSIKFAQVKCSYCSLFHFF